MAADRMLGGARRLIVGAPVGALLVVLCLRFLWLSSNLAAGQVSGGYFSECEGRTGIVREPNRWEDFPPSESFGADGQFSIAPGNVRVLQLSDGTSYAFWLKDAELAPYLVVGDEIPQRDSSRAGTCLLGARTSDFSSGSFQLADWNGAAPWSADATRLAAIAKQCGGGARETPLTIELRDGRVTVTLGRCTSSYAPSTDNGSRPYVAAVAGVHGLYGRRAPVWLIDHAIGGGPLAGVFLFSLLLSALLMAAFRLPMTIVLASTLAGARLLVAVLAPRLALAIHFSTTAILILLFFVGAGALVIRAWRAQKSLPRRFATAIAALACIGGGGWIVARGPAWLRAKNVVKHQRNSPLTRAPDGAQWLLTGYSSAADAGIRAGQVGLYDALETGCANLAGRLTRDAVPAQVFPVIAQIVAEHAATDGVIFFGGTNDDFLTPLFAGSSGSFWKLALHLFEALLDRSAAGQTPERVLHLVDVAAAETLGRVQEHTAAIAATVPRAPPSPGFFYFHDFLMSDLASGRSEARRELVQRRATAVTQSGGTFIDLLPALRDRASVSWFNDLMHPSIFGAKEIAQAICLEIGKTH